MANKIQQRRDTDYNWMHSNPVLSSGEIGFETDTKKLKIGDGITQWASLTYFSTGVSGGTPIADDLTGTIPSAVLANSGMYIGTSRLLLNRASGSLTLAGVSIDGSANSLKSATTAILVSSATAPTAGQVLTAVNDSTANWQTPAGFDLNAASGILAVIHGGTGSSVSTGTGSVVLSSSPTVATALLSDSAVFDLVNTTTTTLNFAGSASTIKIGSGLPGNTTINHDLHIAGDLTYSGQATVINATNISVDNALVYLAANNVTDTFDIGILGSYDTTKFTGFIRDASDGGTWKLFSNLTTHPTFTADFANTTYDNLRIGSLTATTGAFSGSLTATTGAFSGGLSATSGTFSSQVTASRFISTTSSGIAPFVVTSETPVTGLNIGGYSSALKSATTVVNVADATAPTAGHILTATSSTSAVWAMPTSADLSIANGVLDVLHGGTGVTQSTGTGSVMLNTNPSIGTALSTHSTVFNLVNTTAAAINFAGAATNLTMSASTGTTTVNNNLQVAGNITFGGLSTQVSATQLQVNDTLIYMASGNTADIFDIGILGTYDTTKYSGLVRDASDSTWKLFNELTTTPTTTVDFAQAELASLHVGILQSNQLISTITTGTAPLVVTSATPVTGLNIGGYSSALKSATTVISVASATAPTTGQVLTAVSGTSAVWQTPSSGGGSANISAGDSAPITPVSNELWFDTVGGRLYVYYANTWIDTNPEAASTGGAGSSVITSGITPPISPVEDELWFDTIGGRLYVYYANNWVDTNPEAASTGGAGSSAITAGITPPSTPIENELWFDTIGGRLYVYYANNWIDTNPEAASTGGTGSVSVNSTEPVNSSIGDMWFDTISGRLYVYYANTWIDTNPETASAGGTSVVSVNNTAPSNAAIGDMWYDTDGGRMYVYFSNTWIDTNPESTSSMTSSGVIMSDNAPSNPIAGDLWFDSVSGQLYIRYSDTWVTC